MLALIIVFLITLTVAACANNMTDEEKVAAAKDALTLGDTSAVTSNLELPLFGENNVTITWVVSQGSGISSTGVVTRTLIEQTATLTATLSSGEVSDSKDFTVKIPALTAEIKSDITSEVALITQGIFDNWFNKANTNGGARQVTDVPNNEWYVHAGVNFQDLAELTIGPETFEKDTNVAVGLGQNRFAEKPAFYVEDGNLYISAIIINFETLGNELDLGTLGRIIVFDDETIIHNKLKVGGVDIIGKKAGSTITSNKIADGVYEVNQTRTFQSEGALVKVLNKDNVAFNAATPCFTKITNSITNVTTYNAEGIKFLTGANGADYYFFQYANYAAGAVTIERTITREVTIVVPGHGIVVFSLICQDLIP